MVKVNLEILAEDLHMAKSTLRDGMLKENGPIPLSIVEGFLRFFDLEGDDAKEYIMAAGYFPYACPEAGWAKVLLKFTERSNNT